MNRPTHLRRFAALLMVLAFAASACSSSDEISDGAGDASSETTAAAGSDEGGSGDDTSSGDAEAAEAALSCDDATEPSQIVRSVSLSLASVTDAESEAAFAIDYAAALEAVAALRPIQNIEGPLGTMQTGLDNLEADIIAVQEGRYGEQVGEHGVATMNAVIGTEVC